MSELIPLLQKAFVLELQAVTQYACLHASVRDLRTDVVEEFLNEMAEEAEHARLLAQKIFALSSDIPRFEIEPPVAHTGLIDALKAIKKAEEQGIDNYKAILEIADKTEDSETKILIEQILLEETNHRDSITKMLGDASTKVAGVVWNTGNSLSLIS